jgi:hypothetical protein
LAEGRAGVDGIRKTFEFDASLAQLLDQIDQIYDQPAQNIFKNLYPYN